MALCHECELRPASMKALPDSSYLRRLSTLSCISLSSVISARHWLSSDCAACDSRILVRPSGSTQPGRNRLHQLQPAQPTYPPWLELAQSAALVQLGRVGDQKPLSSSAYRSPISTDPLRPSTATSLA
ncbi:hypothetical protein ZWY2020_035378 [Hordeum vulgare]|nr:hypothetical protein ZWY2020_035378 [Hordeum vulgare]